MSPVPAQIVIAETRLQFAGDAWGPRALPVTCKPGRTLAIGRDEIRVRRPEKVWLVVPRIGEPRAQVIPAAFGDVVASLQRQQAVNHHRLFHLIGINHSLRLQYRKRKLPQQLARDPGLGNVQSRQRIGGRQNIRLLTLRTMAAQLLQRTGKEKLRPESAPRDHRPAELVSELMLLGGMARCPHQVIREIHRVQRFVFQVFIQQTVIIATARLSDRVSHETRRAPVLSRIVVGRNPVLLHGLRSNLTQRPGDQMVIVFYPIQQVVRGRTSLPGHADAQAAARRAVGSDPWQTHQHRVDIASL